MKICLYKISNKCLIRTQRKLILHIMYVCIVAVVRSLRVLYWICCVVVIYNNSYTCSAFSIVAVNVWKRFFFCSLGIGYFIWLASAIYWMKCAFGVNFLLWRFSFFRFGNISVCVWFGRVFGALFGTLFDSYRWIDRFNDVSEVDYAVCEYWITTVHIDICYCFGFMSESTDTRSSGSTFYTLIVGWAYTISYNLLQFFFYCCCCSFTLPLLLLLSSSQQHQLKLWVYLFIFMLFVHSLCTNWKL